MLILRVIVLASLLLRNVSGLDRLTEKKTRIQLLTLDIGKMN